MTVDIIVQRGDSLHQGEDVESPLLSTLPVALELGRNLLNKNSAFTNHDVTCLYRKNIRVGDLSEVHDALQGQSWRGRIKSVALSYQGPGTGIEARLQLERPE